MNRPIVLSGVAVITLLLAVALAGYLTGGWYVTSEDFVLASAEEPFIPSKYDERLIELDKEAIDNAYREQVEHLIAVWFRDATGQPARAVNGVKQARKAYIDMQKALEKREEDIDKLKSLQGR